MTPQSIQSHARITFLAAIAFLALMSPYSSRAEGDLSKVKHVIIIMQENHSFDNYFGALALAPGSPYHQPGAGGCAVGHHNCVDGLTCTVDGNGNYTCANQNFDDDGSIVKSFHDTRRCLSPGLQTGR